MLLLHADMDRFTDDIISIQSDLMIRVLSSIITDDDGDFTMVQIVRRSLNRSLEFSCLRFQFSRDIENAETEKKLFFRVSGNESQVK